MQLGHRAQWSEETSSPPFHVTGPYDKGTLAAEPAPFLKYAAMCF